MSRRKVIRTMIAGDSALAMVAAMSSLATVASGQGSQDMSGDHGKKSRITVPGIMVPVFLGGFKGEKGLENKSTKLENAGKALEVQARAISKEADEQKEGITQSGDRCCTSPSHSKSSLRCPIESGR